MLDQSEKQFIVGKVLKPRGLKGEIKIKILTDFPQRFKEKKTYVIFSKKIQKNIEVLASGKIEKEFAYLKIDNFKTLEDVEPLIGSFLKVKEKDLFGITKNDVYLHEIVGCSVWDAEKKQKKGIIKDVLKLPAGDTYEVLLESGKNILIPVVKDFVVEVSVKEKRVAIQRIEEFI